MRELELRRAFHFEMRGMWRVVAIMWRRRLILQGRFLVVVSFEVLCIRFGNLGINALKM